MVDIEQFLENTSSDDEKVIKELLNLKTNVEAKTELNHEQIVEVCKLKHIAKKYKLTPLSDFIKDFMILSVSKDRKGRKEYIQALQSFRNAQEATNPFIQMGDKLK